MSLHFLRKASRRFSLNEQSSPSFMIPPQNYPGLVLDLRGDNITNESGSVVSTWPAGPTTNISATTSLGSTIADTAAYYGNKGVTFINAGMTFSSPVSLGGGNWTIAILYKTNNNSDQGLMYGPYNCQWRWQMPSGNMWLYMNGVVGTTSTFISPYMNTAKLIFAVNRNNNITWIDGQTSIGTTPGADCIWDGIEPYPGDYRVINGTVAELQMWNSALTDLQIQSLYLNYYKLKYSSDPTLI